MQKELLLVIKKLVILLLFLIVKLFFKNNLMLPELNVLLPFYSPIGLVIYTLIQLEMNGLKLKLHLILLLMLKVTLILSLRRMRMLLVLYGMLGKLFGQERLLQKRILAIIRFVVQPPLLARKEGKV